MEWRSTHTQKQRFRKAPQNIGSHKGCRALGRQAGVLNWCRPVFSARDQFKLQVCVLHRQTVITALHRVISFIVIKASGFFVASSFNVELRGCGCINGKDDTFCQD